MPIESAKVRYYRNEANRTGRYPITTGLNSHKINSIKRRARLPESYESAATTVPYSQSTSRSQRTQSANTVIEQRRQPTRERNTRRRIQRALRTLRGTRGNRGNRSRRTVEI